MTDRSAIFKTARRVAFIAAAGFLCALPAAAQTRLPPPVATGAADARQDRIEELEGQLREAEARNEETQRQLYEANRELNRLRAMVGELAGVNQSLSAPPAEGEAPPPPGGPTSLGAPLNGGNDQGASLNPAQQRATGTLGSMPANAAVPLPPPAPRDPADVYSQARELLVNGRYAEAEAAFGNYLEDFPRAENAADARFWFAFTQLARNSYQDAAGNFVQYLQTTPNGPRAAEAQVRLGMALVGMGQQTQGCQAFGSLARRYPNASRAVRDLAVREARAARCAA